MTEPSHLGALLRRRAHSDPDRAGFSFSSRGEGEEETLTYGALDRRASAIAEELLRRGLAGERVLVVERPSLDYVAALFGCFYAGAIAVPLHAPQRGDTRARVVSIIADCAPRAALATAATLASSAEALADLQLVAIDGLPDPAPDFALADHADGIAFLQYTSGSTSTARGAVIRHRNVLHNLGIIRRAFRHTADSRGVIWLPPYHDMGLVGGILQPVFAGFPVLLFPPLHFAQRPMRWLEAVSRFRATTSGGPNFAYELALRAATPEAIAQLDLSSWSVAFNGGEPVRTATLRAFAETFAPAGFRPDALFPCYGLAECTLMVSGSPWEGGEADSGETAPELRVVVADPETLAPRAEGEDGEICVRGGSVAGGYWGGRDPEVFQAHIAGEEGPFLRTGDLGSIERGRLRVTGRAKDVIVIRGRNHHAEDIEAAADDELFRGWPRAAIPTAARGTEGLVILQEVPRRFDSDGAMPAAAAMRDRVVRAHGIDIEAIVFVRPGTLPRTPSGKVRRFICRERYDDGSIAAAAVAQWSRNKR